MMPSDLLTAILLIATGFALIGMFDDLLVVLTKLKIILFALLSLWAAWLLPLPMANWIGIAQIDQVLSYPVLAVFCTAAGYFFITNVVNFIDGMDGLAFSQLAVIQACIAVMAYLGDAAPLALLAMILLGLSLAFLSFNLPPARLYAGDSGALYFGFLTILLSAYTVAEAVLPPAFIFLAFLPIATDVLSTLLWRYRRRKNLLSSHREHFYQLLDRSGQPVWQILCLYLVVQFCMVAVSLILGLLHIPIQLVVSLAIYSSGVLILYACQKKLALKLAEMSSNRI